MHISWPCNLFSNIFFLPNLEVIYIGKQKKKNKKRKNGVTPKKKKSKKPKTKTTIVKKKGKADIIAVNTRTETVKVRTKIKKGNKTSYGSRSYELSTKKGLSPKRKK